MIDLLATVYYRKKFNVLHGAACNPFNMMLMSVLVRKHPAPSFHHVGPFYGGMQVIDKILSLRDKITYIVSTDSPPSLTDGQHANTSCKEIQRQR